jgi:hypothetical protein
MRFVPRTPVVLKTEEGVPLVAARGDSAVRRERAGDHCKAKSVDGVAEPAEEVAVQVLLIVTDPGDVAVGA